MTNINVRKFSNNKIMFNAKSRELLKINLIITVIFYLDGNEESYKAKWYN